MTSGNRFDPDSVSRIRLHETTQADVEQIFGQPGGVRVRGSGGSEWRYDFRERVTHDTGTLSRIGSWIARLFGARGVYSPVNVAYSNEIRHRLTVYFDDYGIVRDYSYERTDKPSKRVY